MSQKSVSLIVAIAENGCIGSSEGNKGLPWHLKEDMRYFKEKTTGNPIVLGRKTFEAFGGKALPNRLNIIITRDESYQAEGVQIAHSLPEALMLAEKHEQGDEIFICGGAQIYKQSFDVEALTKLYITEVALQAEGDTFFPEFDKTKFVETSREKREENTTQFDFVIYEKK